MQWRSWCAVAVMMVTSLTGFRAHAGVTPWLPFELDGGHIKIAVKVAGFDGYAILDTGAQGNAINSRFIREHEIELDRGGKITVLGVHSKKDSQVYNNVPLQLFGADTELDGVAEMRFASPDTAVLLGAPLLSQFIVQIDYPNSRMRLLTRDAVDLAKAENIQFRRQLGYGQPIVEVTVNSDERIWLVLDTGNNGGLSIDRRAAERLGWLELPKQSRQASDISRTAEVELFSVPELKFGPYTLENVIATMPAEGETAYLESRGYRDGSAIRDKKVVGLLGYDVFKHFVLTLDYRGGHLHVGLPEEPAAAQ